MRTPAQAEPPTVKPTPKTKSEADVPRSAPAKRQKSIDAAATSVGKNSAQDAADRTEGADRGKLADPSRVAELAERAGFLVDWQDAHGAAQRIPDATLATLLEYIGLRCDDEASLQQSLQALDDESPQHRLPPLITAVVDEAIVWPRGVLQPGMPYTVTFEDGSSTDGKVASVAAEGADDADKIDAVAIAAVARAGYHTLCVEGHETTLAVAPHRCFSIADALAKAAATEPVAVEADHTVKTAAAASAPGTVPRGAPNLAQATPAVWGVSAQVYGLRREDDAGVGDFTALTLLARTCAASGAAALAISPMHAMFSADPGKFSPYSPSSRLFLNVLHIDPAAHFGAPRVTQAIDALSLAATLRELENAPLIDWPGVATARLAVLRYLFDQSRTHDANLLEGFQAFCEAGGAALERHARFEALHAHRIAAWKADAQPETATQAYDWRHWPEALRDPASEEVAAFADAHRDDVDFHLFLQWLANEGLAQAQQAARDAGMPIGLIADLAVGCDSIGSQTWSDPTSMLRGVSVGAPPDLFNQAGQSWGLTTFSPRALVNHGFSAFIDMVRHAFAHAGGIRVDHILGLRRLWLVPEGKSAREGAYLLYPIDDLLRLLALESWRYNAVVIGEDLGTVPPGLREQLADAGLLGMRVLWFEREKAADAAATVAASASASTAATASERPRSGPSTTPHALASASDDDRDNDGDSDNHDTGLANPSGHSDIADITDLSDLGHLDELTSISGIISLSDDTPDDAHSDEPDVEMEPEAESEADSDLDAEGETDADTVAANAIADADIDDVDEQRVSPAQDSFVPPRRWSHDAIAMTTTHDLPTIAGWWHGHDIAWRHRIGQSGQDETILRRQQAERLTDRAQLWRTLAQAGLVPVPPAEGSEEPDQPPVDAVLQLVAMTAAPLALFPMEDLLGLEDQPNLPGSIDEHPNWRRRLSLSLDQAEITGRRGEMPETGTPARFHQRLKLIDSTRRTARDTPQAASLTPTSSTRKTPRS